MPDSKYAGPIDASPTKAFFVDMLTRDISLEDAILDLLDNCVDGVLRETKSPDGDTPYKGFYASVTLSSDKFEIRDNCGGIPWSEHDRAFRQGRPCPIENNLPTVGTYGIGMKRAIYKIGRRCLITTRSNDDTYQVAISPDWFVSNSWELNAKRVPARQSEGTTIEVSDLLPEISDRFRVKKFSDDLTRRIESHYAVILNKGFKVELNGNKISPKPIAFRFTEKDSSIRPYIFRSEIDGVEIFLAVGLREPIPGADQVEAEQVETKYSTDVAGWTVICNDRVVLYCNKEEQTGWGEATVPQYHPQFRAISGVVEFRSTDARKLPTTTTKRGIELSSRLYSQVKNRMREGLKLFTDYTNHWKTREREANIHVKDVPSVTFTQLKAKAVEMAFTPVKTGLAGEQFKPSLPRPLQRETDLRITYRRERQKVERLAVHFWGDSVDLEEPNLPKKVGERTFDDALKQVPKKRVSK